MRKALLLFSMLLCLTGCGPRGNNVDLIPPADRVPAAEIKAHFLNNSEVSSLARLKGKVVVLDFWATWCGPCIMEIPTLVKMYDDYRSKGLELLGLSVEVNDNRPKEFFDQFISAHKINYPIGLANMDTLKNYGISPIPATFFIDKSGRIALSFVGVHPEGDFIGAVEKLLAE